ncbi:rna-directed dna polymerase from mobile element jockey-like protein [Lasius niger]|uniref:Rna-directed dna polymerase from mobile element jockey-like protein n=1 Tax=Lasius niger TaxID=67767 RepID=A0A0J7N4S5_LASNI|nr:rna-directed dna polymerase from mobile element jockey-like protein [Lasius niger]
MNLKILNVVNILGYKYSTDENGKRKRTSNVKMPLRLFELAFEKNEDVGNIYALNVLCNQKVTTGYHYTKDYTKDRSTEPKRANCGQGHTANYRGCMIAVELQRLRDKARKEGTSTYWPSDPNKCPDVIDMFICKGLSTSFTKVEGSLDLSSDHTPIVLTLSETVITEPPALALTNRMTDWDGFSVYLENSIVLNVPLKIKEQLENNVKLFTEQLQQAAKKFTPELKQRIPRKNYSLETKQLILDKRRARRKWQLTRHPADKTVFNNLSQQLKRLNDIKNEGITSYLENLTDDKDTNYLLWKATKRIRRPIINAPPIKKTNNAWARSKQEKADVHAEHLEKVF